MGLTFLPRLRDDSSGITLNLRITQMDTMVQTVQLISYVSCSVGWPVSLSAGPSVCRSSRHGFSLASCAQLPLPICISEFQIRLTPFQRTRFNRFRPITDVICWSIEICWSGILLYHLSPSVFTACEWQNQPSQGFYHVFVLDNRRAE